MRQLLIAIAVLVYGLTSMGWVLNVHYCMGKVDAVHLFEKEEKPCGTCGMSSDEAAGCCHDEEALVLLVQDQKPPVFLNYNLESPFIYLSPTFSLLNAIDFSSHIHFAEIDNSPPDKSTPLYLRNRVFRI